MLKYIGFICLFSATLLSNISMAQTLYKSVGPDGKITCSDKPPLTGRIVKTMQMQDLPNTALPAKTLAELEAMKNNPNFKQALSTKPAGAPQIAVLFSASWCGYCKQSQSTFFKSTWYPVCRKGYRQLCGKIRIHQSRRWRRDSAITREWQCRAWI